MAWSIGNDIQNRFQVLTHPTAETKAALKAYRDEQEARLKAETYAVTPEARGTRFYCGTLSGFGIPQPDFALEFTIESAEKPLPKVIACSEGWLVDETVRAVFEQFDPDVHGFWPVSITWKNGSPVEGARWLLNIGARKDTISEEASEVVFRRNARGFVYQKICVFETAPYPSIGDSVDTIKSKPLPVFLEKAMIGDSNLWTEKYFGYKAPTAILVTDQLFDALTEAEAYVIVPEAYLPEM